MDLDDEELKATRRVNGADKREHRVYAIKFAVMQKQIDEKDKKIKELEEKQKQMCEEYCPKLNKMKDKIEKLKKEYEIALEENSTKAFILKCQISVLDELLKEVKQ